VSNLHLKHDASDTTALPTSTVDAQARTLINETTTLATDLFETSPAWLLLASTNNFKPVSKQALKPKFTHERQWWPIRDFWPLKL
jgi:hypothetical protein